MTGLVGGMSSVFSSTWSFFSRAAPFRQPSLLSSRGWRLIYAVGLILGGSLYLVVGGQSVVTQIEPWRLLIGGFLIGFGARLGHGCTAGHGICGLASLQLPSLLAVVIFLGTAIVTAHVMRGLGVAV
jgi:uncharacterized membrane protein YedE/YeeE